MSELAAGCSISVVIVNWNSRQDLAECLRSLSAQTEHDFEIVVVDNGSSDGSLELVRRDFPSVVLIETGENLGFAEGCNRGIAAARGSWIALLNNDATADPRWLAELRRLADGADARLGMIQSKILFKHDPQRTNSTGVLLSPNGSASDRGFDQPAALAAEQEEVFCVSAGAALYRRAMLDETRLSTGFFDRSYFMYFEDFDLGWRCRLAGWSALYAPSAVVVHAFRASSSRRGKYFAEAHCNRNRVRTILKNASLPFALHAVPVTLTHFGKALHRDGLGAFAQYWSAVRDGLAQRAEVARMTRVPRRAVERRWVAEESR